MMGEGRRILSMYVVLTCKCSAVGSLIPEKKDLNYGTWTRGQELCSAFHEIGVIAIFSDLEANVQRAKTLAQGNTASEH